MWFAQFHATVNAVMKLCVSAANHRSVNHSNIITRQPSGRHNVPLLSSQTATVHQPRSSHNTDAVWGIDIPRGFNLVRLSDKPYDSFFLSRYVSYKAHFTNSWSVLQGQLIVRMYWLLPAFGSSQYAGGAATSLTVEAYCRDNWLFARIGCCLPQWRTILFSIKIWLTDCQTPHNLCVICYRFLLNEQLVHRWFDS